MSGRIFAEELLRKVATPEAEIADLLPATLTSDAFSDELEKKLKSVERFMDGCVALDDAKVLGQYRILIKQLFLFHLGKGGKAADSNDDSGLSTVSSTASQCGDDFSSSDNEDSIEAAVENKENVSPDATAPSAAAAVASAPVTMASCFDLQLDRENFRPQLEHYFGKIPKTNSIEHIKGLYKLLSQVQKQIYRLNKFEDVRSDIEIEAANIAYARLWPSEKKMFDQFESMDIKILDRFLYNVIVNHYEKKGESRYNALLCGCCYEFGHRTRVCSSEAARDRLRPHLENVFTKVAPLTGKENIAQLKAFLVLLLKTQQLMRPFSSNTDRGHKNFRQEIICHAMRKMPHDMQKELVMREYCMANVFQFESICRYFQELIMKYYDAINAQTPRNPAHKCSFCRKWGHEVGQCAKRASRCCWACFRYGHCKSECPFPYVPVRFADLWNQGVNN